MRNRKRMGILGMVIAAAILLALPLLVYAESPYCHFSGTVQIDGTPAPAGTAVSAWVDGAGPWNAFTRIHNGKAFYSIAVPPRDRSEGDTVYFSVNGIETDQTGKFRAEGHYSIPLSTWSFGKPEASFSCNNTLVQIGQSVSFSDTSNNSPSQWEWDFDGDGITDATDQHPTHVYHSTGNYSVSLTATNARGSDTTTKVNFISVFPMVKPLYAGWNSVTFTATTQPVVDAVASISNEVQAVWQQDNQNKQWLIWSPDLPEWANDLLILEQSEPYYIRVSSDCLWSCWN